MTFKNKEAFAGHEFDRLKYVSYRIPTTENTWMFLMILEPGVFRFFDTKEEHDAAKILRNVSINGPHNAISIFNQDLNYVNMSRPDYQSNFRKQYDYHPFGTYSNDPT